VTSDTATPGRRRGGRSAAARQAPPEVVAGKTAMTAGPVSSDQPSRQIFSSPATAPALSPTPQKAKGGSTESWDEAAGAAVEPLNAAPAPSNGADHSEGIQPLDSEGKVTARQPRSRRRGRAAAAAAPVEQSAPAGGEVEELPLPIPVPTPEPATGEAPATTTAEATTERASPRRNRGRRGAGSRATESAVLPPEDQPEALAPPAHESTAEPRFTTLPADAVEPPAAPDEIRREALAADDDEWRVAPASTADLAAIARATAASGNPPSPASTQPASWSVPDEEMVTWEPAAVDEVGAEPDLDLTGASLTDGIPRRRRRRGRGRRGSGRSGVSIDAGSIEPIPTVAEPSRAAESSVSAPMTDQPLVTPRRAPRQAALPPYPVEFEPVPPPTKRKPARRPGTAAEPRFSKEEQREIDQFVQLRPHSTASSQPAVAVDDLRASLLTPEEARELDQVVPQRGPAGGRRRTQPVIASTVSPVLPEAALQPTPAFLPMPSLPVASAGDNVTEALLARQNVILDTLMERQIALLRNIERSLIALDRRLSGGQSGSAANQPRVGVFVDVPNVIYAAERIGYTVDFGKMLALLTRNRELVRASAYAPVSDDPQMRLETQKFVAPFVNRGYRIITKPLKRFADGTMKGNFDVELAMDVLTMADRLDVVCLVSGDGDFHRLVEMVASKGVRVEIIAFSASTSAELRTSGDEYIDLGLHLREICV